MEGTTAIKSSATACVRFTMSSRFPTQSALGEAFCWSCEQDWEQILVSGGDKANDGKLYLGEMITVGLRRGLLGGGPFQHGRSVEGNRTRK